MTENQFKFNIELVLGPETAPKGSPEVSQNIYPGKN